jgi:hypothetical protein
MSNNWRRNVAVAAVCLCGLAGLSSFYWSQLNRMPSRLVDFTNFYSGAYLVGTPKLYQVDAHLELQRELVNQEDPSRLFLRWPYWAAILKPLTWLPYESAARLWLLLLAASLVVFVFLFPVTPRWVSLLTICWSIPVFDALGQGQDSPFVLVFLAATICLFRAGRPFAAGLVLSLCTLKYHMLVLVPLLVVAQKRFMPNIRGSLHGYTGGGWLLHRVSFEQRLSFGSDWRFAG